MVRSSEKLSEAEQSLCEKSTGQPLFGKAQASVRNGSSGADGMRVWLCDGNCVILIKDMREIVLIRVNDSGKTIGSLFNCTCRIT